MSILGIKNRTENWKTAFYFSPFFRNQDARLQLAQKLIANHVGSDRRLESREFQIELFWKGMRDHLFRPDRKKGDIILNERVIERLASAYRNRFAELRNMIEGCQLFSPLKKDNYMVATAEQQEKLASNLFGAEIDIVLASEDFILIGEAKDESALKGDGRRNLVHQLVLQYVSASILVSLKNEKKEIVPFVVVEDAERGRNLKQVEFMTSQENVLSNGARRKWMSKDNVLSWDCIRKLWPEHSY